ncbi:MAG: hypothetical protein J5594_04840 [Elusimicrobiaceae bacterium]|nr:hypothetical protein [Elusimicrobiaceae bacterium]
MKKIFIVFLGVICVLSACNRSPNPKESLIATGNALQNCDADRIDKYIDISSVINGAIDVAAKQEINGISKDEIIGITAAKVMIVPIAKQFILEGIKQLSNSEYKDYIKLIKVEKYEILNNKDGIASAKVTFNFEDAKKYALDKNLIPEDAKPYMQDSETTLVLKMKQNGDYWQITEITNLEELIKKYAPLYEEQKKKQEEAVKEVQAAITLASTICLAQQTYFLIHNVYTNNFEDLDVDFSDDSGNPAQGSSFVGKGITYSINNEGEITITGTKPQKYTIKKECFSSMVTCQDEDETVCDEVMSFTDI